MAWLGIEDLARLGRTPTLLLLGELPRVLEDLARLRSSLGGAAATRVLGVLTLRILTRRTVLHLWVALLRLRTLHARRRRRRVVGVWRRTAGQRVAVGGVPLTGIVANVVGVNGRRQRASL